MIKCHNEIKNTLTYLRFWQQSCDDSGVWDVTLWLGLDWWFLTFQRMDQSVSILKGQVVLDKWSWTAWPQAQWHYGPSKCTELVTQQHSFTVMKIWMFRFRFVQTGEPPGSSPETGGAYLAGKSGGPHFKCSPSSWAVEPQSVGCHGRVILTGSTKQFK